MASVACGRAALLPGPLGISLWSASRQDPVPSLRAALRSEHVPHQAPSGLSVGSRCCCCAALGQPLSSPSPAPVSPCAKASGRPQVPAGIPQRTGGKGMPVLLAALLPGSLSPWRPVSLPLGFLNAGVPRLAHGLESCQKSVRSAVPVLLCQALERDPGQDLLRARPAQGRGQPAPLSPTFRRLPGTQPGRRRGWKRASASALWRTSPWTISSKPSSRL